MVILGHRWLVMVLIFLAMGITTNSARAEIQCGKPRPSEISFQGQVVDFAFSGLAGERVAIGIENQGQSALFAPCWQLFDAEGNAIGRLECETNQSRVLRGQGPYRIQVSDHRNDGTGEFVVSLEPMSSHLNGATGCARTIGCMNVTHDSIKGYISHRNIAHSYALSANEGERIGIAVSKDISADKAKSSLFSPCWTLLDQAGSSVGRMECEASAERTIPKGGRHTIRVIDHKGDGTGAYTLRVFPVGAYVSGEACAKPITCGKLTAARLKETNETHAYSFAAQAGQPVTISISKHKPSQTFQPCWQLRDPFGSPLGRTECERKAARTPKIEGQHLVHVFDYRRDGAGEYQLNVRGRCGQR